MQPHSSLARIARPLSWLAFASLVALPAAFLFGQFQQDDWRAAQLAEYPDLTTPAEIASGLWAGIALVDLVAMLMTLAVLWHVFHLLTLYARGAVLTLGNAHHIARIGRTLIALAIFGVLGQTIDVLLLTWGNPAGQRSLSISLTDLEIGLVLAGGVMVLIGWSMRQAADIADDHARII